MHKFLQWYEIHWQVPFDMDRELLEYCHSDVDIMLNACWKFRKLFMDITGPHLKNGWYCTRRMHGTSACMGYGTANVHGSRPENCMEMHPSKSTWGMVTLKTMIMCDKLTSIVYTRMMPKHYGVMYNKCIVNNDYSTIPFGY